LDGTNELGRQTLSAEGVVTLANPALTAGAHNISAVYSGDANFNPHTVSLTQVVNGPGFGMSATPRSATLKSGSSAVFTIGVAGVYGFNGAVSLSCSVFPTLIFAPTCAINPTSITPTPGSDTSNLTVATTGPTASLTHPIVRYDSRRLYALWLPICGMVLIGIGLASDRSRKKISLGVLLMSVLVLALGLQLACGGSSNHGGSVTPSGTYTITVHAASGSVTHTTTVTVSVQWDEERLSSGYDAAGWRFRGAVAKFEPAVPLSAFRQFELLVGRKSPIKSIDPATGEQYCAEWLNAVFERRIPMFHATKGQHSHARLNVEALPVPAELMQGPTGLVCRGEKTPRWFERHRSRHHRFSLTRSALHVCLTIGHEWCPSTQSCGVLRITLLQAVMPSADLGFDDQFADLEGIV
jgi:hypothetical protein